MTYIAGIRRGGYVYLIADSAVTTGRIPRTGYEQTVTSFGETQIFDDQMTVQEAALKVHHFGSIAVAVAGDVRQANHFLASLKTALKDRGAPSEGLLLHVLEPYAEALDLDFHLLVAIAHEPSPLLLSFNMRNNRRLESHVDDGVVQTGSPTDVHIDMLRIVLRILDERLPNRPDVFLIAALGWLQSLGTREHLLERGIGGAFYGVYADADSITWQPDVVFGVHHRLSGQSMPVVVIVRDNVLVVRSGVDEASRAMYSSVSGTVTIPEWSARWGSFDNAVLHSTIRFVVLIDSIECKVAVFELSNDGSSPYLRLQGPSRRVDGRIQMIVTFEPNVLAALQAPLPVPESVTAIPVFLAWSPLEGEPRLVRFVLDTRSPE